LNFSERQTNLKIITAKRQRKQTAFISKNERHANKICMKIEQIKILSGANVYSHKPVLVMRLDLEDLTDRESRDFPAFNENLLTLMPTLREHTCGLGYAGGFVEKLKGGTFFGHVVEHVAIELSHLAACDIAVNHGKTRLASSREPNVYNVVVEYRAMRAMRFLLERAVLLVEKLLENESLENLQIFKDKTLEEARRLVARYELGPSTRSIVEAAQRRGIPVQRIGEGSLVQLGYGKNLKRIQAATTSNTSAIAVEIACDKDLTKQILRNAEIPVPVGEIVCTEQEAVRAFEEINAPVAVKPLDGRQGKGVSLNLSTADDVRKAFRIARQIADCVLVEEMFAGRDYRVLIVGGKMAAASERIAPHVVGDGVNAIRSLVEKENQNPLRGDGHEKSLTKLLTDDIAREILAKQNYDFESVPAAGETVKLRDGCNLSTGGTARDVTKNVHETVRALCERAARIVGLDVCGVDLVLPDIAAPFTTGGIIELNAAPGLRMHLEPSAGEKVDVGAAIVENLYPAGAVQSRIPVVSVTGTNGKTTVARMIAHVFATNGNRVGMTTTSGIWIGGECIATGDTTGPASARVVLNDPTVEVAVLETARGGLLRRGLGYDWADVGILTNIGADHIGQDGIETIEDILHIKSLVAERVRAGGTLVLNADDKLLARLADAPEIKREPKRIVCFSLKANHLLLHRHVSSGGTAYAVKNGWITEMSAEGEFRLARVGEIPATVGGLADFNVANVLAAIAACRAENLASEKIVAALREFRSAEHNEGRFNLYRANGGYVLVDYAHNSEAVKAICRMAANWQDGARRVTGIVTAPGDRDNDLIKQVAREAVRGFNRVVFREDADLRGRAPGEIAQIMLAAAKDEAPDVDCRIILDESEALRRQISLMREEDIVVCFYENFDVVREVLARCDAEPTESIEEPVERFSLARA
jgi:cyanophycin synthetase